jgi:hypothetical protein
VLEKGTKFNVSTAEGSRYRYVGISTEEIEDLVNSRAEEARSRIATPTKDSDVGE